MAMSHTTQSPMEILVLVGLVAQQMRSSPSSLSCTTCWYKYHPRIVSWRVSPNAGQFSKDQLMERRSKQHSETCDDIVIFGKHLHRSVSSVRNDVRQTRQNPK